MIHKYTTSCNIRKSAKTPAQIFGCSYVTACSHVFIQHIKTQSNIKLYWKEHNFKIPLSKLSFQFVCLFVQLLFWFIPLFFVVILMNNITFQQSGKHWVCSGLKASLFGMDIHFYVLNIQIWSLVLPKKNISQLCYVSWITDFTKIRHLC